MKKQENQISKIKNKKTRKQIRKQKFKNKKLNNKKKKRGGIEKKEM